MPQLRTLGAATLGVTCALSLTSCDSETLAAIVDALTGNESGAFHTGWFDNDEDYSKIEDDIRIVPSDDTDRGGSLPSRVSLSDQLPPIGNQGDYGTCVGWAVAYNCRSWIGGRERGNLTTSQFNASNEYSPLDLFRRLSSSAKGAGCAGTSFEPAFQTLIDQGCATLSEVPYQKYTSDQQDCDCEATPYTSAANNRIQKYRQIDHTNVTAIKRYLSEGRLVVMGAILGDNFMQCSSASVLQAKGSTNLTGMHAAHALVISGYDDDKGPNGAFEITNSWDTSWGSSGRCWVDYRFFVNDFCYCAFVAYGNNENASTLLGASPTSSVDLEPIEVEDVDFFDPDDPDSDDPAWRELHYDVVNNGSSTVPASSTWATCYCLYNAYDANEMSIVLVDYYSDAFSALPPGAYEGGWGLDEQKYDLPDPEEYLGLRNASGYACTNKDVAPGGRCSAGNGFQWPYQIDPSFNGQFYFVLIADAFANVQENNEENNYFYITGEDGGPLSIVNGVIQFGSNKGTSKGKRGALHAQPLTARSPGHTNTYDSGEIAQKVRSMQQSGELRNKAQQWLDKHPHAKRKRTLAH